MSAKAEQKERSHETILQSASRLLREKGIAGARVADVMEGAGLTVGGFYAHFGSKKDLIDGALRLTGEGLRERLFAGLEEKPASARAEVILKRYLSVRHRDETLRGCPLPAVVGEVGTTAPEYGPVLEEQIGRLAGALETHLETPRGEVSPKQLSIALVALMYGGLSMARALRGTPMSEEILKACRAVGQLAVSHDS